MNVQQCNDKCLTLSTQTDVYMIFYFCLIATGTVFHFPALVLTFIPLHYRISCRTASTKCTIHLAYKYSWPPYPIHSIFCRLRRHSWETNTSLTMAVTLLIRDIRIMSSSTIDRFTILLNGLMISCLIIASICSAQTYLNQGTCSPYYWLYGFISV